MSRRKNVRKPTQARSKATVEAILEAAARIFVEEGMAGLSTAHIAERAGVSVGTLYQYFANKHAIVEALAEQQSDAMVAAFSTALQGVVAMPPGRMEAAVSSLLDATLTALRVRPELTRRLLLEAPRGGDADLERRWRRRYTELVRAALWQRRDRLRDGEIELMSYVVVQAGYAVFLDAAAFRPELLAGDALRDELLHLVVRYLSPVAPDHT